MGASTDDIAGGGGHFDGFPSKTFSVYIELALRMLSVKKVHIQLLLVLKFPKGKDFSVGRERKP